MKKIFGFLAVLLGGVLAVSGAEITSVNPVCHKGIVKDLGKGVFEITFPKPDEDWQMVHLDFNSVMGDANFVAVTVEQLEPKGITTNRIFVAFKKTANNRENYLEENIRVALQDNKPHRYSLSTVDGNTVGSISLVAHMPDKPIKFKVSNIVAEKRRLDTEAKKPLPPVTFKGKPFFPLGAFDMGPSTDNSRRSNIDAGFLAAGGNIGIIGCIDVPENPYYNQTCQPALMRDLEAIAKKPEYADVALLVDLTGIWLDGSKRDTEGCSFPVEGAELERRKKILADAVKECAKYPNIIGYYIDEPENYAYGYVSKHRKEVWEKYKDAGLTQLIIEWTKWVYDAVRENHPGAKMMITLGWWTTYEVGSDLYDVNIPNEYPAEFPPHHMFQLNYDATLAVKAARKAGNGKTVVYMPGMFNFYEGAGPATLEHQRYCCFTPLVCGAMGIFGWRLARCTEEYRQQIVYPVMKEVNSLKHYFLGSWHDDLVSSDRDSATAEYLKKYQVRSSLVVGKDDGEYLNTENPVNDISYCLRRDPASGKYLLIVVNNRSEAQTASLTVQLDSLPASVKNIFDGRSFQFQGKVLKVELKPFDTQAYEF